MGSDLSAAARNKGDKKEEGGSTSVMNMKHVMLRKYLRYDVYGQALGSCDVDDRLDDDDD